MRSVGYRGSVVDGVPFDDVQFIIPSDRGRVLRDGLASPGEYVAGWIKRGATGVLGTNRSDAKETVTTLREDAPALLSARAQDPGGVAPLLAENGLRYVDLDGWHAVLAAEARQGAPHGRGHVKISDWDALLQAALPDPDPQQETDPAHTQT